MWDLIFQMCFGGKISNRDKLNSVFNSAGEIENDEDQNKDQNIPEHVDNPFLNRNVHNGILGFRYETKTEKFVVYSSIEAKTFCMIMQLKPLKRN